MLRLAVYYMFVSRVCCVRARVVQARDGETTLLTILNELVQTRDEV